MLNADKSEVMLVGTGAQLQKVDETQSVEVLERHSTTEIIALAASSTQKTVQASRSNL